MKTALVAALAVLTTPALSRSLPVMTQREGGAAGQSWQATGGQPLVTGQPRTLAFCFFRHASVIYYSGSFYAANGLARGRVGKASIRYQGRNHELLDGPPDAALAGLVGDFVTAANKACDP